jgi:hypothetical protein
MKNILVYCKGINDNKFNALSSLQRLTYAPNLMHAALFPEDKKDRLIEWANSVEDACKKHSIKIELRYYKKPAFHKVG